jgi:ATP-dependent Lon protease
LRNWEFTVSDDPRDPEDRAAGESQGDPRLDRSDGADEHRDLWVAGQERVQVPRILPVLPVRDVVIYPGVTVPLAIGRPRSLAALEAAGPSGFLIVATQRDPATEEPGIDDLHPVACVVRIVRIIDAKRDGKQAVVVGVARTRLGPPTSLDPALTMPIEPIAEIDEDTPEREALWQRVVDLSHRVIDLHDDYPDEWKTFVQGIPSAGLLADLIASTLPLPPEEKVTLLGEADPVRRLARVAVHLEREVTIAETQRALSSQADEEEMDPQRRERLLRRRRWIRSAASVCSDDACATSSRRSARPTRASGRWRSCGRRSRPRSCPKQPASRRNVSSSASPPCRNTRRTGT